ncbi:MAG: hypothetical protein WC503_04865 [Candidatus Shapirobacteria bacterium]
MNKMNAENSGEIREAGATLVREAAAAAVKEIDKRISDPATEAADEAARIGFLSKLWGVAKPHVKEIGKIRWDNTKAVLAGVLSVLPIIGQAEAGGVEAGELAAAAILEGATSTEAAALAAGGSVVSEGGVVVSTLRKLVGENTLEGVKKAMKAIDPFKDVPVGITAAAGAAELAGVDGALVVPAVVQLGVGIVRLCGEAGRMGKDVYGVIKEEIESRTKKAGSPGMGAAAAAFA